VGLFKKDKSNRDVINVSETVSSTLDKTIVLSNGQTINAVEWMERFGKDRLSLTKELARTYNIPLKEATSVAPRIYDAAQKEAESLTAQWTPTHKINPFFEIDESNKRFAVYEPYGFTMSKYKLSRIFAYEDLLSYELLEDGDSVTSGGLGSAAAGALLFGSTGAVVGSITGKKKTKKEISSLKIKITLKSVTSAPFYINLLTIKSKSTSLICKTAYEQAQQILSTLDQIAATIDEHNNQKTEPQTSSADEILKYKNLLDMGAISQEEFDAKKKELLGL
jgi:hypothetical protein